MVLKLFPICPLHKIYLKLSCTHEPGLNDLTNCFVGLPLIPCMGRTIVYNLALVVYWRCYQTMYLYQTGFCWSVNGKLEEGSTGWRPRRWRHSCTSGLTNVKNVLVFHFTKFQPQVFELLSLIRILKTELDVKNNLERSNHQKISSPQSYMILQFWAIVEKHPTRKCLSEYLLHLYPLSTFSFGGETYCHANLSDSW